MGDDGEIADMGGVSHCARCLALAWPMVKGGAIGGKRAQISAVSRNRATPNTCHPDESRDPDPRYKAMAISVSVPPSLGPDFRRDDKIWTGKSSFQATSRCVNLIAAFARMTS
jgi:hypothetical protein